MQGNTKVVKANSGTLVYQASGTGPVAVSHNTLTISRSGEYRVVLPDGSKVWLNNASSLRYPTVFADSDRTVELTGEAYFEIRKDTKRPFMVKVGSEKVAVLGTNFNIMAYPDEGSTQITLLSGKVRVHAGNVSRVLKPDEQAQVSADGGLKVFQHVNTKVIVSWKDGFFYFHNTPLKEILQQLARWYDVAAVYQGEAPDMEIVASLYRNLPLKDILKAFETDDTHFRLEGRKLIVFRQP